MKIVAIDQSTSTSAFSVFDNGEFVRCGLIKSNPKEKNTIDRMIYMHNIIRELIETENPDWVAIEGVQMQANSRVYSTLSQLQGMLFTLFYNLNVAFSVVAVPEWKAAFGIKGVKGRPAQKALAIKIVKDRYGIDVTEDEAEAIGIATWCLQNIKVKEG